MADQNVNAVGCLGNILTTFGFLWIGFIVLVGMGVLSETGMSGGFAAGIGGSILPGLLLLAAGRAVRRRARTIEARNVPIPTVDDSTSEGKRVPSIRPEPLERPAPTVSRTSIPAPLPEPVPKPDQPLPQRVEPVPKTRRGPTKNVEESAPHGGGVSPDDASIGPKPDQGASRPKTSQELVDEARRRWGADRPR
jgi:type IV secretory pathway VirB10-like protein